MRTNVTPKSAQAEANDNSQGSRIETLTIEGMTCAHCVKAVSNALKVLPLEVKRIERGLAVVNYEPQKVSRERIVQALADGGYRVK